MFFKVGIAFALFQYGDSYIASCANYRHYFKKLYGLNYEIV